MIRAAKKQTQNLNTVLNTFLDTHTTAGECVTKIFNAKSMSAGDENKSMLTQVDSTNDTAAKAKAVVRARVVEKIRSELNIEKWPAIWQPSKSKNKPALRVMQREMTGDDDSKIVSRVEVGYTQLGTLTTEEQKLLYVLIKLWEDAGKPDVQVFFSTRSLARMLKKKGWGTNVIQSITKSLRKLRTIPIEWVNSYFDKTKEGAVLVDRRPFSILGELRVVERSQDGAVNSSLGYFKFDDHILRNLQLNYTKPVCIEEFFKLKSEIAQLIYTHVDLILNDKKQYERRSKELFDDLGLKNAEYEHMYERKRALDKAVKELGGIRLSTGILRSASVEKTSDGKDYKVVFSKAATPRIDAVAEETFELLAASPVVINNYSDRKDPLTAQAEELVRYFYRVFHSVDSHQPRSKETAQAFSLISQHGLEQSQSIVRFAHDEAAKTSFDVQHFGAVLSYTSRALSAHRRKQAEEQLPVAAVTQSRPLAAERQTWKRGEARLVSLTEGQYAARFEKTKTDLFRESPSMALYLKSGSKMFESTIRARVVRELDGEPMDLILLTPALDAMCQWHRPPQNLPL